MRHHPARRAALTLTRVLFPVLTLRWQILMGHLTLIKFKVEGRHVTCWHGGVGILYRPFVYLFHYVFDFIRIVFRILLLVSVPFFSLFHAIRKESHYFALFNH